MPYVTIFWICFVVSVLGCGEVSEKQKTAESSQDLPADEENLNEEFTPIEVEKTSTVGREPCKLESGKLPSKIDMFSIVELINKLPKPVTIPCLIDVLPRPLEISATDSELSVQPAEGENNPRIFLEVDWFILTFALSGKGSETVEFSDIVNSTSSIKGEIAFPVKENLAKTAAMDQVARSNGGGTRCAGCHFNEEEYEEVDGYKIYKSNALRPFERQDVPLKNLRQYRENCKDEQTLRCQILNALFEGEEELTVYLFPESMPTLF